ncbi:MAG: hypothetical protein ACLUOI_09735 [Eisenbergiella sp.]
MVGRPVSLNIERPEMEKRDTILKVVDLTVDKSDGSIALDDVSFEIKTGKSGSGRREAAEGTCETLTGLMTAKKERSCIIRENIVGKTPAEIIKRNQYELCPARQARHGAGGIHGHGG